MSRHVRGRSARSRSQMNGYSVPPEFNRGTISPMTCLQEGWTLIKDDYWLMVGMTLVAILLGAMVPFGIILGAMMCGLYMCLFARMRREPVRFDMLFKGFDYFVQSLIVTLLHIIH